MTRATREPAIVAAAVERGLPLPVGEGDRYSGYWVPGVAFESGDVLTLRRFPVTSVGPGYTSVWHRAPDGTWIFYSDAAPTQGCTKYFAPAIRETIVAPIRLEWGNSYHLEVAVDGGRLLAWSLALASTLSTRFLNAATCALPAHLWTEPRVLAAMSFVVRAVLRSGRLHLTGLTPNGSRFLANPRMLWDVSASRAVVDGHDLGPLGAISPQPALADVLIPRRPLFAVGAVFLLAPDGAPATHSSSTVAEMPNQGSGLEDPPVPLPARRPL